MSEYNAVLSTLTSELHDRSSAKELTEVKMLLALIESYSADGDPRKAYMLLCGYSVIGVARESEYAALLQKAVSAETGSWAKMPEHTFSSGTLHERLCEDGIPENVAQKLKAAMYKPTLSECADLFGLS